jgi:hypothetical protein
MAGYQLLAAASFFRRAPCLSALGLSRKEYPGKSFLLLSPLAHMIVGRAGDRWSR